MSKYARAKRGHASRGAKREDDRLSPMEALAALTDRDMDALILMVEGGVPSDDYDTTHLYDLDLIMQPSNHARVTRLGQQVAVLASGERGPLQNPDTAAAKRRAMRG
jgi:hypothetical protein